MNETQDPVAGRWIVLNVSSEEQPKSASPSLVHDAIRSLGEAFLHGDTGLVASAVHGFREALGAVSVVIEHFHDRAAIRHESGDVGHVEDAHRVLIDLDEEWSGSISVVFGADPSALDHWALDAAADLLGGWMRREQVTERLERKLEERDRFVASVSHEIRTPLAAVLGLAEELHDRFDLLQPWEVRELVGLIADQSKEIARIVEDLIAFSSNARADFAVRRERTRLDDVVRAAVASVPADARSRLVMRRIESVHALCDPLRTRQIVRNLITNARRHGGEQTFIDIYSIPDRGVVITVADSGGPIAKDIQDVMFEPYASTHRGDDNMASLGLGLTVSRQLARTMGGDLVYRWEGESRFELHLPAAPA